MTPAGHSFSWLSSWWLDRAMATTKPFARGALLDVGCGRAPYRGFYDVTEHVTMDWPGTLHDRTNIDVYGSAEALPFGSHRFDTVLCTEVLEHLQDPRAAIAEAARVLRPGGHLILSVPFLYGIHEEPYDFTRFTEHGLRALLERYELAPVHLLRRGGSIAVISDLGGKLGYRVASRAMKASRIPKWIQAPLLRAGIVGPQRALAGGTLIAERLAPRLVALVSANQVATLGYVIVARRCPAKASA